MKVLFLALTAVRARAVKRHCHFLLEHGVDVSLITTSLEPWQAEGLDGRVEVHTLSEGEARHPLPRVERILVFHGPRRVFQAIRKVLGPRHAPVRAVEARYERAAQVFHQRVFMRGYRVLRPWLLWRVARTRVLPRIDLAGLNEVVVGDSHSVPLGWHIARLAPDLKVSFSLDRAVYADVTAPADPEEEARRATGEADVVRASDV